ncbi:hypothetical protein LTR84_006107 [Exophiala bonariae]|uniref:Uncharacterized protein n=1 Tax=Exophiala bonariae TaxID=1690606 RepID=A0AAV9N2A4_9EURO|nr:hypothetical protein LTR84_006107 [Exophiala bonariae]
MSQVDVTDHLPPRPSPAYWTASRCNRTLRKLKTFVSQLEKWHKDYTAFKATYEKVAEVGEKSDSTKGLQNDKEQDADWLSTGPGKAGAAKKKTYASRSAAPTTPAVKRYPLGRLSLRTPSASAHLMYKTVCVADPDGALKDGRNGSNAARKSSSHTKPTLLQDYDVPLGDPKAKENPLLTSKRQDIIRYGNIAIVQFLVATSDARLPSTWSEPLTEKQNADQDAREYGAKSLVSMCLAKLSESLVDEQKESDAKKDGYDGECDIIGTQLEELENYFGRPNTGWPYLRDVTRSYGIASVQRLIESGTMDKYDARGLAVSAFGSPLLADFGEAITDTLIRMDTGRNETFLERGGSPGFGAYGEYKCNEGDDWRTMMKFRWLTQAIRQESDAHLIIKHVARFDVLRNAYASYLRLQQVSAAELIETTFFRDLQEDLHHRTDCIRTDARFDWDMICGTPPSDFLGNRLSLVVRMFYSDPTEWTTHLIEKICTQVQLSMEWCHIQGLSRSQKLVIGQIFFVEMCLVACYRRNVRKSLLAYFEAILSESDGTLVNEMESYMVAILLSVRADGSKFMASIMQILGIQCAENELVHKLLARVCAEAAMDYATDQVQQEISAGFWASRIEAEARKRNKGFFSNKQPRSVDPMAPEDWKSYRWDRELLEWVETTPKKTRGMRLTTKIQQLDGACESPPLAKSSRLPKKQAIRPKDYGLKRKKSLYVFEVHRDDEFDFEYKKPRLMDPKSLDVHPGNTFKDGIPNGRRSAKRYDEEDSEDELSLLN